MFGRHNYYDFVETCTLNALVDTINGQHRPRDRMGGIKIRLTLQFLVRE